ncbi:MAG: FAD-binding oxidoreductase [Gammaproteobacteria bacterium]|nr:FAD-binding oxidoreductase [Gammaproteobacteria bacterium]
MSNDIVAALRGIVGDRHVVTGPAVAEIEFPWSTHSGCAARAIVRPETPAEVSAILRCCNLAGQTVVPFGGMTNLVQGCATTADDIVLSLARMNRVEDVDKLAGTLTAQAGVTLHAAQEAAAAADWFFPVDIGARASCQLGGLVSNNAGGNKVIRYGMTRDTVLGLEAVLADGTVISSMNRYIKNNSGFDLKHMFIGSEGVLGVITRLVFRLRATARSHNVALLACKDFDDVVAILEVANRTLPNTISAFEVMWNSFYSLVVQPRGRLAPPLEPGAGQYVLIETMGVDQEHDAAAFEALLEDLMQRDLLVDGMLAKSDREREMIWEIRDEVEPVIGGAHNFDVSLRSADVGDYVSKVEAAIAGILPEAHVIGFGHLGDNNVHISVSGVAWDDDKIRRVEEQVYGCLAPFDGAISAEHGIGLEKRAYLPISRSEAEIDMMKLLKRTLDPNNILNPGKVVDVE